MSDRTRALVLGGGGPVGVAWEIGLAAGLHEAGVAIASADTFIGTSAGSITGAKLAGGEDPAELAAGVGALFRQNIGDSGVDQVPTSGLASLFELLFASVEATDDPDALRAKIGAFALEAQTVSEEAYVGGLRRAFEGAAWPAGYSCTAVDATTGAFVVWDEAADVDLAEAIASSCSVPGIFPPVTIGGTRYIDGGMRSGLNADLATGHDIAVVVSCMPLEVPDWLDDPRIRRFFEREREGIEVLRDGGAQVEVVVPDEEFLALSGMGMNLMDFSLVETAADAGRRLGKAEAERIGAIWS